MARLPSREALGARPDFRPDTSVRSGGGEAAAMVSESGRMMGGAFGQIGEAAYQVDERRKEEEGRFEIAQANAALLKAKVETISGLDGDPDYATYGQRYTEAMAKARASAASVIKDPRSRQLFDLNAQTDEAAGMAHVTGMAKAKEKDVGLGTFNDTMIGLRQTYLGATDPSTRESTIKATNDLIVGGVAKGYIDAAEAPGLRQKATVDFVDGYLTTLDPTSRMTALKDGTGSVSLLPADRRAEWADKTQLELDRIDAKAKAERDDALRKVQAEVKPELVDALADIAANGDTGLLPPERVKAAFPDDPQMADEIIGLMDRGRQFYVQQKTVSGNTAPQDDALIESYHPSGPQAHEEAQRQADLIDAVAAKRTAYAKDSAAAAIQSTPALKRAWADAGTDPKKIQAAIALSDQVQRQVGGVALPRVLAEPQAKAMVEQLTGALADPNHPEKIVQTLDTMRAAYGPAWDRVSGELQAAGLPPQLAVADQTWFDPQFRNALVLGLRLGTKDLAAALPPSSSGKSTENQIEETIFNDLAGLDGTFRSPAVGQAYRDAAKTVAMVYMRQGMGQEQAITAAAKTILSQYQLVPVPGSATRLPGLGYLGSPTTFRVPAGVDAGKVSAGLKAVVGGLDQLPLDVPPSLNNPSLPQSALRSALVSAVQSDLHVRTLPDDSGVAVLDPQGQPLSMNGQPVTYTWDQLLQAPDLGQSGDLGPAGPGRGPSDRGPQPADDPLLPGTSSGADSIRGDTGGDALVEPERYYDTKGGKAVGPITEVASGRMRNIAPNGVVGPWSSLSEIMAGQPEAQLRELVKRGGPEVAKYATQELQSRTVLASLGYERSTPETMSDAAPELPIGYRRAGADRSASVSPDLGGYERAGVDRPSIAAAYAPGVRSVIPADLPLPPKRPGPKLAMPPALARPAADAAALPMPPALTKPLPPRSLPVTGLKAEKTSDASAEAKWRQDFAGYLQGLDVGRLQRLVAITQGTTPQGLVMPIASGRVRMDTHGEGEFGAARPGQPDGKHHGTDLEASPGEIAYSPASGTVTDLGFVYNGDMTYRYVEIMTPDQKNIRLMYVRPGVIKGQQVYAGITPLGAVQDISKKWGKDMKPHVHLEIHAHGKPRSNAGQLVDAWPLLHQGDVALAMIQAAAAQRSTQTQVASR